MLVDPWGAYESMASLPFTGRVVFRVLAPGWRSTLSRSVGIVEQAKLMRMSPGMRKEEVVALMGTDTAGTRDGIVNNPWTSEAFADKDGARYEVLYYVTSKNLPFTPVRKSLTTPVVLKDNKVIGWGKDALDRIPGSKAARE